MVDTPDRTDDLELILEAQKRFNRLRSQDQHNIDQSKINVRFVYDIDGAQWDEEDRKQRKIDGRACLTSNQVEKHVNSIVNAERDQRIAGHVRPVDSEGDVEIAAIIAGIIRQIEHASDAEVVYTNGGEQAVAGGTGYWRIKSEIRDDSFDQELFLVKINNQFSVTLDPEGMFAFIDERITKEEFKYKYPDAEEENVDTSVDYYTEWYPDEDSLYVREYF